jgi:hypothetical protein
MPDSRRELSRNSALPAILIYTIAITCGVLTAIAVQIPLGRAGFDLVAMWQNLLSTGVVQLRIAGPWWAIAGLAFIVGGITAAGLSRLPPPWRRFRALRWAAGAGAVFLLAHIGHKSAGLVSVDAGAHIAASLGALGVAALMSLCGAYLTARR